MQPDPSSPVGTPPAVSANGNGNTNGNGKSRVSWKRVACVAMIWLCFSIALLIIARHGFPDRGWELLNVWLPWNVAITAAFIGVDTIAKLTKP